MQNWQKASVENASSERQKQHTIERAVTVSCLESQESPASSTHKARMSPRSVEGLRKGIKRYLGVCQCGKL